MITADLHHNHLRLCGHLAAIARYVVWVSSDSAVDTYRLKHVLPGKMSQLSQFIQDNSGNDYFTDTRQ